MLLRKGALVVAFSVFVVLLSGAELVRAAVGQCTIENFSGLKDQKFGYDVSNLVATLQPASPGSAVAPLAPPTPAYCEVKGTLWPQITFRVALPVAGAWNGRFYQPGGGGFNGSVPSLTVPLALNYAAASTDSGHSTSIDPNDGPNAKFAYPDSDPIRHQKKEDFAYRSYRETAILAKTIITRYYGKGPKYSYWVGCSEGGREALMMAQRFPELFDGIVAGAPISYFTKAHMWSVWNPYQFWDGVTRPGTPGQIMAANQLPALAKAVYDKCDALDGLVDGLIDDPRDCLFDATKDLPICATATDTCFTTAQAKAIKNVHDGVKTSKGQLLFWGQPPGVEVLTRTLPTPVATSSGLVPWILPTTPGGTSSQQGIGESSMQYFSLTPQRGPTWNFYDFNYDKDPQDLLETSDMVDMIDPDLSAFKTRHGKLIHYHGWADPALTPLMTVNYYERVVRTMGLKATSDFYKLYMVPGMFHCSAGVACWDSTGTILDSSNQPTLNMNNNQMKFFNAVVNWVETGTPPDTFVGTRLATTTGLTARTRLLCPYPEVERYSGSGSTDDAGSFMCVPRVVQLSIDPNTLSLHSETFTVYITLPNGFEAYEWGIKDVVCNGAHPIGAFIPESIHSPIYAATFRTRDLVGVAPGNAVTFNVNFTFNREGKHALSQASTTIKVTP